MKINKSTHTTNFKNGISIYHVYVYLQIKSSHVITDILQQNKSATLSLLSKCFSRCV